MTSDTSMSGMVGVEPPSERALRGKSARRKGRVNERRSMQVLEAAGYRCTRSAGSLGAWDIIGIGSTDFVLCQVKSTHWPGPAEMETLREFVAPPNARKIVHRWMLGKRLPDAREI